MATQHRQLGQDLGYTKHFHAAMSLLDCDRGPDGESLLREAVEKAKHNEKFAGPNPVARALHELGVFFATLRDWPRAIEVYLEACARTPHPDDRQGMRDHMTHLMNLGELLVLSERLDEAEHHLLRGLTAREQFYGKTHPGYGFGLEPLVSLRCKQGRLTEAAQLAKTLCQNLCQHPRLAFARVLRIEVTARKLLLNVPPETPFPAANLSYADLDEIVLTFEHSHRWTLHEIFAVLDATLDRVHLLDDQVRVADALLELVLANLDPLLDCAQPERAQLLCACASISKQVGDLPRSVTRMEQLVAHAEAAGSPVLQAETLQALGLTLQELDRNEDALRMFSRAFQIACDAPLDLTRRAGAARNIGLFLAETHRPEQAEPWLRDALELARDACELDQGDMFGRCAAALGVFLQHHDAHDEAQALLFEALQSLDPCEPEAISARSHLEAIDQGLSCGCDLIDDAWASTLKELIEPLIPAGLLSHLERAPDKTLNVILAREATPQELEILERALRHAQHRLKQRQR